MVTKKRFHMIILALIFVVVLSACGSSNENDDSSSSSEKETKREAFSGNVKKIEYEDLIEKLDNEESFFLITMETTDEAFVDSGLEKAFDQALKEYDIEAYYLGLETMDEDDLGLEMMDEYDDDVYEEHVERLRKLSEYNDPDVGENAIDSWYPRSSGLAYSDNGTMITGLLHNEPIIEWKDIQQLQQGEYDPVYDEIIDDMVYHRVEMVKERGLIE